MATVDAELMSAFNAIDPARLDYEQWFKVSAVMHDEGLSEAEWDAWNQRDAERYTERINGRKWASIKGDGAATRKTVFMLAYEQGWSWHGKSIDGHYGWNDAVTTQDNPTTTTVGKKPKATEKPPADMPPKLEDFGEPEQMKELPSDMEPAEMMRRQLACMFHMGESTGCAGADQCFFNEKKQKWQPKAGKNGKVELWYHNAEVFLENHVNTEAGAWIRMNPTTGSKNEDVMRYASALIESDDIDQGQQLELFAKLHLPIRCVVDSGKKSMHAICIIDAKDEKEYSERVEWLRTYCDINGLPTDHSNKNSGRYTRLAGAMRADRIQRLVCEAMGPQSWGEFRRMVAELNDTDDGPHIEFLDLSGDIGVPSVPLPHVVHGLLPREHVGQTVAQGGSGKSFLALELMFAVATGGYWMGFSCERGRVLYADPELHPDLIRKRVRDLTCALDIRDGDVGKMFDMLPLRGHTATAELIYKIVRDKARKGKAYDLIIIDTINAILTGDENSATDVRALFAALQRIAAETHAAIMIFHHTGKGPAKAAGERGRGSSVFLDGPDECMELVPLRVEEGSAADELLKAHAQTMPGGEIIPATAWRLTFPKHRTGAPIRPRNIIFRHPLHQVDRTGELDECKVAGSSADYGAQGGNAKGERYQKAWDVMDETMADIISDIHAEGNKATRAACLDVLNERREAMGMPKWTKATFRNNTLRGGKLRYRVNPATNELYRLTDEQLASEGGAVLDTH